MRAPRRRLASKIKQEKMMREEEESERWEGGGEGGKEGACFSFQ